MRAFYHDLFTFPLPEKHRFPIEKYRLVRERLLSEGILAPDDLRVPPAAADSQLRLAHTPEYVHKVTAGALTPKEIRRIGFPWSPQLVERSRRSVGSSIAAGYAALADGFAVNLAGGTHHAHADFGSGYCVFNDVAVAIRVLQRGGYIRHAAVVDCDVHQGDGTAAIFAGDPTVFTFSVHGAKNFPFHKPPGSLDIPLPDGAGDDAYLHAVERGTRAALNGGSPDVVFYLAGADPFEGDTLGRLSVSKAGLEARDRLVLAACQQAGVPLVVVMGGGYARRVEDTVDIHVTTVRVCAE
ncbi:MAG: histone deacetylase [Anaerolineales bacterium]